MEAGEDCARATDGPIQYQWTLLDGIVRLLSGKYAVLNMIPFKTVEGMPHQHPEKAAALARHLHRRRILAKLRQSAGQDVDGGCGQLRAWTERPAHKTVSIVAVPANAGSPRFRGLCFDYR